ncbi:MAG TPA: hypothetical protein VN969_47835 [Streptosporangiaceae bacterium]|nr:hypothetical protein [Streptosporangiaceae bacterium]
MGPVRSADRLDDPAGEVRCGPRPEDARHSPGQQVRVDGIGRLEPERASDLCRIERPEQQGVGAAEERPVIGGQPFHHVQVTA